MFLFYILLLAAVLSVLSVGITKMTLWMTARLGHGFMEQTHRSAEYLMETGGLPPFWFKGRRYRNMPSLIMKMLCLGKLKKIISYFTHSTLTADEETRRIIVSRLTGIYNEWTEMEWGAIQKAHS